MSTVPVRNPRRPKATPRRLPNKSTSPSTMTQLEMVPVKVSCAALWTSISQRLPLTMTHRLTLLIKPRLVTPRIPLWCLYLLRASPWRGELRRGEAEDKLVRVVLEEGEVAMEEHGGRAFGALLRPRHLMLPLDLKLL